MIAKRVPKRCSNRRLFENVRGGTDLEGLRFDGAVVVTRLEMLRVGENYDMDRV
jgi:hypothetical protein